MFSKKCNKCGEKVSKKFEFCPHCGNNFQQYEDESEYGMLGREDYPSDNPLDNIKLPLGFNTIFKSLVKQLDKELGTLSKELKTDMETKKQKINLPNLPGNAISISFSSFGGNPLIRVDNKQQKPIKIKRQKISREKAKQFAKLPKKETKSNVRRLGDRVIYEIEMPEVVSLDNIIINQLENSIEIKALAKKYVLYKILKVALPILRYKLEKENLILELQGK